ncbi:MAG: FG-GAP-like repeat-containing protein [Pseudomonadota bacterium]
MAAILTLNAGSSSIKFSVYRDGAEPEEIAVGQIDGLGPDARLLLKAGGCKTDQAIAAADRVRDVRGAAIADANGDGAPDVATASTSANEVLVFVNNGSGGFGAPVVVDAALTEAQDVALGDLNGDGRTDVVAVARGGAQVAYYPGDGSGGFGAAVAPPSSTTAAPKPPLPSPG